MPNISRTEYRATVYRRWGTTLVLDIVEITDFARTERSILNINLKTGKWVEINAIVREAGFAVTGKGWRHMSGANDLRTMLGKIPA